MSSTNPPSNSITIRRATLGDVETLTKVINAAYREAGGWTTETHLVSGARALQSDVTRWLTHPEVVENEPILVAEDNAKVRQSHIP
jgi:hypothetical protein